MDVASALAAVTGMIDAGKLLRDTGKAWGEAELKLKIADLVDRMHETQDAMRDLSDAIRERDAEIARLKREAEERAATTYEAPFYWAARDGQRDGPFCQRCHDADGKRCRLIDGGRGRWNCAVCSTGFDGPDRAAYKAREDAMLRAPLGGPFVG